MKRAAFALIALAAALAAAPASAQIAGCSKFRDAMTKAGGDLNVDFIRPLVVSRGDGGGVETWDLTSKARIDGVLRCRAEAFVSFEATLHMPADAALIERYTAAQTAALVAGLGWQHARAKGKAESLGRDAAEYLRGSAERGDVVVAGKVEEHLPGGVDLGAIWTSTDRTFILVNAD